MSKDTKTTEPSKLQEIMKQDKKSAINRREFIRRLAAGGAVAGAAALTGCSPKGGTSTASTTAQGDVPTDKMTMRTTPTSGDKVSLLGYGCMRWPNIPDTNKLDQEMINRLVDYALEHGVNYFDTAPVYHGGLSERVTGIALKRHPRDSYFIATKLSNQARQLWSREESLKMYHNSFKELQTDYIDYLLLHAVGMGGMEALHGRYLDNGVLEFLLKEREAGRIRNLGFSYHGDVEVFDWLLEHHDHYKWDFVQIQLNYVDWRHAKVQNPRNTDAEYLYNELEKRGIPAVIMEPLLGGRLSNVHDHIATSLRQRRPEASVASWAFRFAGSHPGVLTVLSGMTYMEHLQDNIRTYSPLEPLTDEDCDFLDSMARQLARFRTIPCNDCKYCMPCPYGLDIPAILLHYNKCINEGRMPDDKQDENYRRARREFLIGYDRSVPRLRQSDHCIGCNQYSPLCPQRINIPRQMQAIDKFVEELKRNEE